MKFTSSAIILATTCCAATVNAFQPQAFSQSIHSTTVHHRSNNGRITPSALKMAEGGQSEVEKLRAAAAKAREEAAKLAKELGKDVDASGNVVSAATATLTKPKDTASADDLLKMVQGIQFEGDVAKSQAQALDGLVESGDLQLWNSANAASSVALRPFPVSLQNLESRTGGQLTVENLGFGTAEDVSLDDFKYATLGVTLGASVLGVLALSFLPENIGATVCYFMALIPILFLAVGSTAPGLIAGAIQSSRGTSDSADELLDRICRHEAGHFLCGYLSGLPIAGYATGENGVQCVEFHPSQEGPVTGREFSESEIAALSCVSMSGSVAEVLGLGNAKGGDNDLIQLDGFFRRSEEFIGAQKQQDLTRWGALASYNLINANRSKYDELVTAFKAQKSVPECIAILESR